MRTPAQPAIAFAVTAHVAFLNLQVTGWVFILTGVAGAIIPRSGWLRRTLAAKGAPAPLRPAAPASARRHHRAPRPAGSPRRPPMPRRPSARPSRNTPAPDHARPDLQCRTPVRAENLVHSSDQQSCSPCWPAMMIAGHVPAVRLPPDHAHVLMVAVSRREEARKTAEILILRHQLAVQQRQQPRRPDLNRADRALPATLPEVIPKARRHGLRLPVTPDTILRWHRDIARRRQAASPVAPAARSPRALAKAAAKRTDDDTPVHSFGSLLTDLATICLNTIAPADPALPGFRLVTTPTAVQRQAFDLLGVSHRFGAA